MVKDIAGIRRRARQEAESLYDGSCTISEYRKRTEPDTGLTRHHEETVVTDCPCRLSYESSPASGRTDTAAPVSQGIKLFLAPETEVRPGSKITVTQAGATRQYRASGVSKVYPTHQEVELELFRGWA